MQSRSAPIVVLKVNGITMPVDIRELSPRSIRLLNRVDNRILTPFFYALGIDKRHIELDPATLVRASGRLNEPAEIYFTALAPAELQSSNSELQVGRYGNPRLLETVIKWLDASAKIIEDAAASRERHFEKEHAALDREISEWFEQLSRVARSDPTRLLVGPSGRVEREGDEIVVNWRAVPLARTTGRANGLYLRIRDRADREGAPSAHAWLMRQPEMKVVLQALEAALTKKMPSQHPTEPSAPGVPGPRF
ncbi:hypothetical protein [Bosea sp. ANAM02]|uniref:hypothetical protein n=1 Tax=Bosea sp. ANAM02 TaxID=2020412 RepID=UPI00140EBEC1|nr:hypothetical protein [Bosea sp. ANAM02]BCB22114.1 hypothetical protein OCUBac02_50080 [Bosea sp. ANAM02]